MLACVPNPLDWLGITAVTGSTFNQSHYDKVGGRHVHKSGPATATLRVTAGVDPYAQ